MLLVAMTKPDQIKGLVGIASAVDFVSRRFDNLPDAIKTEVESTGKWIIPTEHSEEPYVLDLKIIEEARQHILKENELYPIHCPVRLIHGMKDNDVPYQVSLDLVNQIDKLGRITFDENDKVYQETIDKIKNTEKLFKEFIDNQAKLAGIFRTLTSIIANVEKMLLGWKIVKFSEIDSGKWPKS